MPESVITALLYADSVHCFMLETYQILDSWNDFKAVSICPLYMYSFF